MPFSRFFTTPRWKNKDSAVRAAAVSSEKDPDLLRALPEIARRDPASSVRAAACRRLQDIPVLLEVARNDLSERVSAAAWSQLETILLRIDETKFAPHQDSLRKQSQAPFVVTLAEKAEHPAVRAFFQTQISSQGQLGQLLLTEPEPTLRHVLAKRIEKSATVQRVLKQLGKKDPAVRAILQQQLQKHDPKAKQRYLQDQALALCEQLEKLIHAKQAPSATPSRLDRLRAIETAWWKLQQEASTPPEIQKRFTGALHTATVMLDPSQREQFIQQQQRIDTALEKAKQWLHNPPASPAPSDRAGADTLLGTLERLPENALTDSQAKQREQYIDRLRLWLASHDTATHNGNTQALETLETLLHKVRQKLRHRHVPPRDIGRLRKDWDTALKQHRDQLNDQQIDHWQQRFNEDMLRLAEKVEQQKQRQNSAAQQAIELIEKARAAIKDGHLAEAKRLFNQHIQERKKAGTNHPLIRKNKHRIDRCWNALKDLRQWQRWSNDKVRQRLIDELKAIPAADWHPDAILAKLKETSAQWKALEAQEKLEGDRFPVRNAALWQKFRTVQDTLFEHAQPYFAERSRHWSENLETVERQLDELKSIQPDDHDSRQLADSVRQAVNWLKKLETLPPAERGRIAKALRKQIQRLEAPLKERYAEARRKKQTLIEESQALADEKDLSAAIESAKSLQKRWKAAGYLPQTQERKLWKKFRTAQDAVFNRLDAEKQQVRAQQQAAREAAQAFLTDIEQRLSKAHEPATVADLLKELRQAQQTHWHTDLTEQWRSVERKLTDSLERFNQHQREQSLKLLKTAGILCEHCEYAQIDTQTAQATWKQDIEPALAQLGDHGRSPAWKQQRQRFAEACENRPSREAAAQAEAHYLDTLIAAEFLTGLKTPQAFQKQRNTYQVNRLAQRMSGESLPDSCTEAYLLLEQLYTIAGVPDSTRASNAKRQQAIEKRLLKLLTSR